jgi:8-oxo-dGTP pyrophosphatase MutT (NUDIX family)
MPNKPESEWKFISNPFVSWVQKLIIIDPDTKKFLTVQRAETESSGGTWDLPGGLMKWQEDTHESLIREIQEETGISLPLDTEFKPVFLHGRWKEEKQQYRLETGFICYHPESHIILSEENSDFKWVTLQQFYLLPSREFILNILKKATEYL